VSYWFDTHPSDLSVFNLDPSGIRDYRRHHISFLTQLILPSPWVPFRA